MLSPSFCNGYEISSINLEERDDIMKLNRLFSAFLPMKIFENE
jgi:hypothetical protein